MDHVVVLQEKSYEQNNSLKSVRWDEEEVANFINHRSRTAWKQRVYDVSKVVQTDLWLPAASSCRKLSDEWDLQRWDGYWAFDSPYSFDFTHFGPSRLASHDVWESDSASISSGHCRNDAPSPKDQLRVWLGGWLYLQDSVTLGVMSSCLVWLPLFKSLTPSLISKYKQE